MIEIRWVVPDYTTTESSKLQYRTIEYGSHNWTDWKTVPVEILSAEEWTQRQELASTN